MINIPLRIRNLIRRHGTAIPSAIAIELGATVVYCNTPGRINGFWRRFLRKKYIGVNEDIPEDWQKQAVIAHEIAHIILHPHYKSYCMAGRTFYSRSRYEDEADEFAAELLLRCYDMDKQYILDFLKNGWKTNKN